MDQADAQFSFVLQQVHTHTAVAWGTVSDGWSLLLKVFCVVNCYVL